MATPGYGAPQLQSSQGTPQMPDLTDPATARRFADQAVAGGNPYGPPPSPAEGNAAAAELQTLPPPKYGTPGANQPPPPPSPGFMTPAMQQYVNQFQQSQASQHQAIDAGLVQALQGLGSRRDAAAKVAATVPGEYDKAYNEATASQQRAAAASGFGHTTVGGNADQALITAGNTEAKAAGHANQPLLEAGITADYSKGATTLDNTHMSNEAELAQAQQAFDMQMLQSQAQYQQAQQAQQAGYQHDIQMANLSSTLGRQQFDYEHPGGVTDPVTAARTQALDAQAMSHGFDSYAQEQTVKGSTAYKNAAQELQTGTRVTDSSQKADRGTVLGNMDTLTLKALRADNLITDEELQTALGLPGTKKSKSAPGA